MSKQQQQQDVMVARPPLDAHKPHSKSLAPAPNYLDEFDEYYLDNEKYIQVGNGGKQRNKKDMLLNEKKDPSGNVRTITKNLQNFEANRRKH